MTHKISHNERAKEKLARIPIKIDPTEKPLRKPDWIRIRLQGGQKVAALKKRLRSHHLNTVCEEASCPNLSECFSQNMATFMIMGDICTRRCGFCDVEHGRPVPLDVEEPAHIAKAVEAMGLRYVVITSVDRDDLRDGGAGHFVAVVEAMRRLDPSIKVEILVPDFRGRQTRALEILGAALPDVFNHNIEMAPSLYKQARSGADYQCSLTLLQAHKARFPDVLTKSGMMLGLGETSEEVEQVMRDLRAHDVDLLTLGQYLQPTRYHMPVARYVTPAEFVRFAEQAKAMGFKHVASAPLVRSSYHAELLWA